MDKKTVPLVGAAIAALAVAGKTVINAADKSPVTAEVEIERPSADVFAYATDPSKFTESQQEVVSVGTGPEGATFPGGRFTTVRRVGPLERPMVMEVTDSDQPTRWAYRAVGGPISADVTVTVELEGDTRSRVSAVISLEGHGLGKMVVPLLLRPRLARQVPRNYQHLKEILEPGT